MKLKRLWIASSLLIMMSAFNAHAQNLATVAEICPLAKESHDGLYDVKVLDITKISFLDPFYLKLANAHAMERSYIKAPLSFADLKELFTNGEEEYNDLYIKIRTFKATGAKHIEVMSWPGDNPYSIIFDFNGKVIATSGDGDYTVHLENGTDFNCPY